MASSYSTLKVQEGRLGSSAVPGILEISLHRPDVRNAFNSAMIADLKKVFETEAADPGVRAVVLRGHGAVFCAGGDLNWMRESVELDFEANLADTQALARMFSALNSFSKPVIGLIHGAAIGGGVGLVSVCDIAVASSETIFSLSEVRLGIIPACIGPFVIPKIGASQARALFVSAERFSAARALQIGLVHEVSDTPASAEARVLEVLSNILQCGPLAMAAAKKLVLDLATFERRAKLVDPLDYVARSLAELRVSKEGQEGIRAFLEKRKPAWLAVSKKDPGAGA